MMMSAHNLTSMPGRRSCRAAHGREGGFVLLAVLIVTMVMAMVAMSMLYQVRAEQAAAAAGQSQENAWGAAMSGLHHAVAVAAEQHRHVDQWYHNPGIFAHQPVVDDGANRWYFTIFAVEDRATQSWRYGLSDESAKLNLHMMDEAMLLGLPHMTPERVDALLAYLADTPPLPPALPGAAGDLSEFDDLIDMGLVDPLDMLDLMDQADQQATHVNPRRGPRRLSSLDELLQIPGFDARMIYGQDSFITRQFVHQDISVGAEPGLADVVTVWSYDPNRSSEGQRRLNLNGPLRPLMEAGLSRETLRYLHVARRSRQRVQHPADLLDATMELRDRRGRTRELSSGVDESNIDQLLDQFTATTRRRSQGLVNINTAPIATLMLLPGVDQALADQIVSTRSRLDSDTLRTPAWLYREGLVDVEMFRELAPYLTAQSYQFHVQIIGYGLPSGRYRMLEAVIDLGGEFPRVVYLRDLSRLNLPFPLDEPARSAPLAGQSQPQRESQNRSSHEQAMVRADG